VPLIPIHNYYIFLPNNQSNADDAHSNIHDGTSSYHW
jgi:hypothetical protein